MGKGKKSKGGKTSDSSTNKPQCTCTHSYECKCGNRPERPSRGHKWDPDTQQWGGKGHKQKGGSGQTASASQQAKTTAVGKTTIEQWQRMPAQLLQEQCQKLKRPKPKFKNIEKKDGVFKYRTIIPDIKDSDKDLFFVPNSSVKNEEQAKEESALLALFHLSPSLPHERRLPEPYKTTWLNLIGGSQSSKKDGPNNNKNSSSSSSKQQEQKMPAKPSSSSSQSKAQASGSLVAAKTYTSLADKRRLDEEKRRKRNEKIRHHEAVRLANRSHPVVMSAKLRNQIEALLRGDTNFDLEGDDEADAEEDPALDEELGEVQAYVEQRLIHEGFTKRQARTSYEEYTRTLNTSNLSTISEEEWDGIYESCLQWLLVHLNEDQLPVGYDNPQGQLFDVIAPPSADDTDFASRYSITAAEASLIRKQTVKENRSMEDIFWGLLMSAAGVKFPPADSKESESNREVFREEVEALEAIFDSECTLATKDSLTTITIKISESDLSLEVIIKDGVYPSERPVRVLVKGQQWPSDIVGKGLHVELIRFIATLEPGEPMIFEIHSHALSLLQQSQELPRVSLTPAPPEKKTTVGQAPLEKKERKRLPQQVTRRPRGRSPFWSLIPKDTPPATAFPKISLSLEKTRKSLPAAGARLEFLNILNKAKAGGRVLLVTGDTGCGKTTQIPQFILEEFPSEAKIVVAQPRRLAATGVANRVANERCESDPGTGSVGYVVRGESAMSKDCRLMFCTTGVLLRQLQNKGALKSITHCVVDEVHERHLDTDVLLGLLKQGLAANPHLCVVLMSATLDAERFQKYWGKSTPRMHIPGRTFPVTDFFLEDALTLTKYVPSKRKGGKGPSSQYQDPESPSEEEDLGDHPVDSDPSVDGIPISELVKRVDETCIEYNLLARLVKHLVSEKDQADDGSILVFLPGAPEINIAMETIKRCAKDLPLFLLPLHGGLQPKEQNLVFRPPPRGLVKVILSTNVAETSVTIPDCTVVIDTCREKQSSYDPGNRMPLLVEQFASRASLKQRRGRAGRVRSGHCYKLISTRRYAKLDEHGKPEISRCALDQTLLSLLFLGVERGSGTFMRTLLDPPSKQSLEAAALNLQKIGAVEPGDEADELRLTPLGAHLAGIPAPPTVGKMLVMGAILGCRSASLAMAAGMSLGRSPFLRIDNPRNRRGATDPDSFEAVKAQKVLDKRAEMYKLVGNSDHALLAAVFKEWEGTVTCSGGRKRVCESLGLSFNGMKDMFQLVKQLDSSLSAIGFRKSADSDHNSNSFSIIRTCTVAAMAPGQVVKVRRPAATYQQTAEGAMELDGDAKGLKFFVRSGGRDGEKGDNGNAYGNSQAEERVFIHPSSANFFCGSYSCPWLVYFTLVRTSKAFLRDVTECSAYSLLLFGGDLMIKADSSEGSVVIDGWVTLSSSSRIVSLVGGLRSKVDELLVKKINDPSFEIANSKEMALIVKLIKTNGEGV